MEGTNFIIILLVFLAVSGAVAVAYVLFSSKSKDSKLGDIRALMSKGVTAKVEAISDKKTKKLNDPNDLDYEIIKKQTIRKNKPTAAEDLQKKLFRAGLYSREDKAWFIRFRIISFVVSAIGIPFILFFIASTPLFLLVGGLISLLVGFAFPLSWLERRIRAREEEIMYYLPLVIEQISIGVSSALDIGPCISHLVTMADERDSHNPVTEMFVSVEKLIRSGLNLEQALIEVAEVYKILELKHTFMFLSQCSKHGGELSKQLQELADSVMTQRQVYIEGKISALPVKATGPLVTIFAGFFALLFSGLMVRMIDAFAGQ